MITNLKRYDIVRSSSRLLILNNRPICRYRVYWNLSYSWNILKVIFLKSNPLRFIETLQIQMALWEGGRNPPWYRKCWPKLLNQMNFWFTFYHFKIVIGYDHNKNIGKLDIFGNRETKGPLRHCQNWGFGVWLWRFTPLSTICQ